MLPADMSSWSDAVIESRLNAVINLRRSQIIQVRTFEPRELSCFESFLWCLLGLISSSWRASYFESDRTQVVAILTQLRPRVEQNPHLFELWNRAHGRFRERVHYLPALPYVHPSSRTAYLPAGRSDSIPVVPVQHTVVPSVGIYERAGSGNHSVPVVPIVPVPRTVTPTVNPYERAGNGNHSAPVIPVVPAPRTVVTPTVNPYELAGSGHTPALRRGPDRSITPMNVAGADRDRR